MENSTKLITFSRLPILGTDKLVLMNENSLLNVGITII